jgi:hypothetical protein
MKKQISLLLVAVALNLSNGAQAASLSSTRRALTPLFRQTGQAVYQGRSGLSQSAINAATTQCVIKATGTLTMPAIRSAELLSKPGTITMPTRAFMSSTLDQEQMGRANYGWWNSLKNSPTAKWIAGLLAGGATASGIYNAKPVFAEEENQPNIDEKKVQRIADEFGSLYNRLSDLGKRKAYKEFRIAGDESQIYSLQFWTSRNPQEATKALIHNGALVAMIGEIFIREDLQDSYLKKYELERLYDTAITVFHELYKENPALLTEIKNFLQKLDNDQTKISNYLQENSQIKPDQEKISSIIKNLIYEAGGNTDHPPVSSLIIRESARTKDVGMGSMDKHSHNREIPILIALYGKEANKSENSALRDFFKRDSISGSTISLDTISNETEFRNAILSHTQMNDDNNAYRHAYRPIKWDVVLNYIFREDNWQLQNTAISNLVEELKKGNLDPKQVFDGFVIPMRKSIKYSEPLKSLFTFVREQNAEIVTPIIEKAEKKVINLQEQIEKKKQQKESTYDYEEYLNNLKESLKFIRKEPDSWTEWTYKKLGY